MYVYNVMFLHNDLGMILHKLQIPSVHVGVCVCFLLVSCRYDDHIYPLRLTKQEQQPVNLLLLQDEKTSHYMWIKDFNRLCHDQRKHQHRKHFCLRYVLQSMRCILPKMCNQLCNGRKTLKAFFASGMLGVILCPTEHDVKILDFMIYMLPEMCNLQLKVCML